MSPRPHIDDLGMGQLLDAISNSLSPGTSVLHVGAGYMLPVPWALLRAYCVTRNHDELPNRSEESATGWLPALGLRNLVGLFTSRS